VYDHQYKKKRKSGVESFTTGLVFAAAFGIYWYFNPGHWWPIFPIIFAGVIPALNGLRMMIRLRQEKKDIPKILEDRSEKVILKIAKEEKGTVTPAKVALESELSLEKAQQLLDKMAKKGYARMNITAEGTIQYEFPDFMIEGGV
jgi:predicted transcriptional regulator